MNSLRISAVAIVLCAASACASSTQSPGSSTGSTGQSGSSGAGSGTGTSGATGGAGATGASASGNSGATGGAGAGGGASGASGTSGSTGNSGASGATGAASSGATGNGGGNSGASGAAGNSGASGTTGNSGGASNSGASGASGASSGVGDGGSPNGDGAAGGGGCAGLPLCDDFESDTANMPPNGWTVVMGCDPATTQNPNGTMDGPAAGGGILVGIDATQAHSGTNSLRVVGGDSCGYYAVNTAAFTSDAALGTQTYARMWARFSEAPPSSHNGFLSMNTTSMASHQPDLLRLGFQNDVIEWNWYGTDSTLPDTDSAGAAQSVAPMANTWVCIEFHIDATTGNIEFWYNGASVTTPGLSWNGTAAAYQTGWTGGGWKSGIAPTSLGLGWGSFNGVMMTTWFDDVALGTSRIGCN